MQRKKEEEGKEEKESMLCQHSHFGTVLAGQLHYGFSGDYPLSPIFGFT
jgi:hypothetical protein